MAFNFPPATFVGQTFGSYTWDGEKWLLSLVASGGGGASPSSANPKPVGTPAVVGVATPYSREDHVHALGLNALPTTTDFNAVVAMGLYFTGFIDSTNTPTSPTQHYWYLEVLQLATNYIMQRATLYEVAGAAVYVRTMISNVWGPWHRIMFGDNNLADLANATTARTNLGLTAYATAALGQLPAQVGNTLPAAGMIGYRVGGATVLIYTASGTTGTMGSVTVGPGVWDLEAIGIYGGAGAVTTTDVYMCLNTVPASLSSPLSAVFHSRTTAAPADFAVSFTQGRFRVNPSVTTTYYQNSMAVCSAVGSQSMVGSFTATLVN